MTYGAFSPRDVAPYARHRRVKTPTPPAVLCAATLLLGAAVGLTILYRAPPAEPPHRDDVAASPIPPTPAAEERYGVLLDPALTSGYRAVTFARSVPLRAAFAAAPAPRAAAILAPPVLGLRNAATETTDRPPPPQRPAMVAALPPDLLPPTPDVPLPAPRPAFLDPIAPSSPAPAKIPSVKIPSAKIPSPGSRPQFAKRLPKPATAPAPPGPSFFDKIFGRTQPSGTALAYALPDDGGLGLDGAARVVAPDRWTAVYNIATHTVTLPDGTRLEAHSGLGSSKDDPGSVTQRMRGATPPAIYELQPREALFHGVAALRLNPIGGTTFGRGGLLAHTYMLGPRGDSNGCVVFRDYAAFRRAYDNGDIRRLVVIAGRD